MHHGKCSKDCCTVSNFWLHFENTRKWVQLTSEASSSSRSVVWVWLIKSLCCSLLFFFMSSALQRRRVHQPRVAGTSEGCEVWRDGLIQAPCWNGGKPQGSAGGGRGYEEEPGECGWHWLTGVCLYLLYFIRYGVIVFMVKLPVVER